MQFHILFLLKLGQGTRTVPGPAGLRFSYMSPLSIIIQDNTELQGIYLRHFLKKTCVFHLS